MDMRRAEAGSSGVVSTALDHDSFKERGCYIGVPVSQIYVRFSTIQAGGVRTTSNLIL